MFVLFSFADNTFIERACSGTLSCGNGASVKIINIKLDPQKVRIFSCL